MYQFDVVSLNPVFVVKGINRRGVEDKSALARTVMKLELKKDAQKIDWVIPLKARLSESYPILLIRVLFIYLMITFIIAITIVITNVAD